MTGVTEDALTTVFSNNITGQRGPPVLNNFCVRGRGRLFKPAFLVFVGPSIHSTYAISFVAESLTIFKSYIMIWWCS